MNTTNIIFKRKCKSVPHLRKKIYSKIANNCLQQQWKTFLANEQQLNPILHELSKAQFDIRSHDKFKFTVRSILMMKREIIKYIQQNQLQKGKDKLRELYQKVNHNEMRKIGMMIIYMECREELTKGLGSGREEQIICWLKEKMNEHLNGNEISFIKIKILTILSILLLRFHGILMATQEKLIIFKTIQLKKKKMLQMDVREQREAEFQCLLYLLFQLYKILYLLKKDQQTIHFYYNQLHAYTQIYLTRQENQLYLDVNEINKILTSMKPILSDLDIYEDSKLRKDLAFAHIQEEIIEQQNQSSKMLEIKKAQQKNRISSSIKISSHKQVRRSSIRNDQKLVINNFKARHQDCVKQETIEDVLTIQKKPISFQFLLLSQERLYVVQIVFKFRNGCNLVDLYLTLKNRAIMLQIYELIGIQLAILKLTFKAISRFLQKSCELLFKANFYFRQMHNLYFADQYIPKGLDFQNLVIAMARIKTQISQYIKQNIFCQSIVGNKFSIPEATLQTLKDFFEKQGKIGESKPEKMMITRRQGFILRQNFQIKQSSEISVKILLKRQFQKYHQYCFFNIFFDRCFKGIQIYYLNDKEEPVDLTEYISKLKKISLKLIVDKKSVKRSDVISEMFALQNKIERVIPTVQAFKVEEELQINQEKLKYEIVPIKASKHHQKRKKKPSKPKIFELIKLDEAKYFLFIKQIRNDYMVYKNQHAKLYLPLNWKQLQWTLMKSRLRLYAGIKIVHRTRSLNYFIKSYRQQQSLITKEQLIVLTFQSHKLIRKASGYSMLLQYKTDNHEYLYEIIIDKQQRYYYLSLQRIHLWPQRLTVDSISQKYPFKLYQGIRQKVSEANWYYINVLRQKAQ